MDRRGHVGTRPEPAPAPPLAPFDDHWFGETVALLITRSAIDSGDDGAYFRLERGNIEAFWGFVGSLGWPAATWRGWLALCRSGSPVRFPDREPSDTTDHAVAFAPTRREEMYKLGYELGLDRDDAAPLDAVDTTDLDAFREGWRDGKAEWDRRLDEMCGSAEYAEFSARVSDLDIYAPGAVS